MATKLYVGSMDTLKLTVYDRLGSTRSKLDLTGTTVSVKASINDATAATWACVIDPDQVNHIGECSYQLLATDLSAAGKLELQAVVVVGARTYKSTVLVREILASL